MTYGGRHMNDNEDDPQPYLPQRFMPSDLIALLLGTIRNLFSVLAGAFEGATVMAMSHSNAVADEREFVVEAHTDIRQILGGSTT